MRLCEHSEACACGAELVSEMFSPLGDARHPARVPWISLDVLGHSSTPSPSGDVGTVPVSLGESSEAAVLLLVLLGHVRWSWTMEAERSVCIRDHGQTWGRLKVGCLIFEVWSHLSHFLDKQLH